MPALVKNIFRPVFYSLYLYFILFIASCSKDPSIPEPAPPHSYVRKVLVEEFTGHYDGHGAIAAGVIANMQNKYPGKVIAVTIHSGYFSKLFPPTYITDFRCNEGDDYFKLLDTTANPVGTINWIGYPDDVVKDDYRGEWGRIVDSLIPLSPEADIKITNHYNSGTRVLNSSIRCEFLRSFTGTYKLVLLLTEDSIVAPQRDYVLPYPYILADYNHRYILRDGITTSWGDILNTGSIVKGDSIVKDYSYILPADFNARIPNENRCRVVAYIYDASNYQIIQAEETKIR